MSITFYVARSTKPATDSSVVDPFVELMNVIEQIPAENRAAAVDRIMRVHPGLRLALVPSTSPLQNGSASDPLVHRIAPLLPKGSLVSVTPNHHLVIRTPSGVTADAELPRFGRIGPPQWSDLIFATLLFVAFSVTLFLLWAVRSITNPLAVLARSANSFALDQQSALLDENGSSEVSAASRALNRMHARVRAMVADRTQMLAAIGHDLRTPITRMRLRVDSIDDTALRQVMIRDLESMESLVHNALSFLRDAAVAKSKQPLDLASLLQTICDDVSDTGGLVIFEGPDRLSVTAFGDDLRRLFTNLVANALAHGREVTVILRPGEQNLVEVDVVDDGPGIADSDKARAFEPFWRGTPPKADRTGFGLGLSIVRAIAEAHSGSVDLSDAFGGGLVCRVRLPIGSVSPLSSELSSQVTASARLG